MSAKARGKRPAPAEDEKTDDDAAHKVGGHEVAIQDDEDVADGKLRCRWGGKCTEEWCKYDPAVVRMHLVKVHGVEKDFTCHWAGNCNTAISAMATLERHEKGDAAPVRLRRERDRGLEKLGAAAGTSRKVIERAASTAELRRGPSEASADLAPLYVLGIRWC
ncbi:hypothetical protein C2E23DRAFT_882888 [Lenzites betulinus]|nr:hypothetical protein C2E23DRAFT_882888 [Lenzites betulinus]